MVVIALRRLREFWLAHPDAETPLRAWYKIALSADWGKFADVQATLGNASSVGSCVVFNVAGNKYRLVARIRYQVRTVFVLRVMTHGEYDDQKLWQERCGCHKPPRPPRKSVPKTLPPKRRT